MSLYLHMKILLIMIVLVGLSFSLSYTGKNSKHVKKSQNYKSRRFINNHLRQTFQEIDYSTKNIIQKSSISWSNESLNLQSSIQSSLYPSSFNIFHFHRFVINLFRTTFLPAGYPESVPPEYLQFQIWNTIQDLCSYLRGIMSTRAVLEGLGVGKADVTAVQATMLWIMRDGASMIGGLLFTAFSSANFGQNAKSWRLFADYINNVGITLDLLAPLSQSLFLPLICLSSVFKSLCGIAAGAAGAVISEHWGSVHGNIAEVNSKNGAQHTAVSLLGLLVSIPFASFASRSPRVMWSVYAVLTIIHVVSNYCAMRTLQLRSINISRGKILVSQFMKAVDSVMKLYLNPVTNDNVAMVKQIVVDENASVYTLSNIARTEPILKLLLPRFDSIGNRITSGISMCTDSTHGTVKIWASPGEVAQYLSQSDTKLPGTIDEMLQRSCSTGRNYTLFYDKGVHTKGHGQVFVCFSDLCTPNTVDQLEALLHAHLLLRFMGNIELSEKATTSLYPLLLSTLKSHRWDTHRIMFRPRNARAYSIKNT